MSTDHKAVFLQATLEMQQREHCKDPEQQRLETLRAIDREKEGHGAGLERLERDF